MDAIYDPPMPMPIYAASYRSRSPTGSQTGSHPWLTLVEFAGVIVVTVALASGLFKRAVRR